MATLHNNFAIQGCKLIALEEDYLINGNAEVLAELESERLEFRRLSRCAVDQAISEKSPPEVYKTWFHKLCDELCDTAEQLSCPLFLGLLPGKWATEGRKQAFTLNRGPFVQAMGYFSEQLNYEVHPCRNDLRLDIVLGRKFPPMAFLRELLRGFGPLDEDVGATADRLLPYYPSPNDISEAIQHNCNEEKPTKRDWFILLFALADRGEMEFHVRPRGQHFDSKAFYDRCVTAIGVASRVTPGFTGPSLPDKHEKLDEQVILGIRAWAAKQISMSQSEGKVLKTEKEFTIDQRMKLLLLEQPGSDGWTVQQFASELKCSKGGVHKTDTWQMLNSARKLGKIEKTKDRRRNGK